MESEKQMESKRQRKTTLCCLAEDKLSSCNSHKWHFVRFAALFFLSLLILCCCLALKTEEGHDHKVDLDKFYAVGDPVYARDLWLVVELASDDKGRRTREGRESAAHVCSAIHAAQSIGWTPLIVGARSPCCRSSRCRHLHPKDVERLNYTLSGHFDRLGQTRMATKSAGFLAAISRGAHFIFQANPEVYYRAGITPKQYQHELERQLRKTTLGISFGLVKSFSAEKQTIFEPYGHFGQSFQQLELDNNISQYKICEVKPPSLEKFLDTDGHSLDLSAPPFTIPGGHIGPFDTRNAAFGRDIFPALFLFPEQEETISEKDQYYVRSLIANALLRNSGGSSKFSVAEISTVTENDISTKSARTKEFANFLESWQCDDYTMLRCLRQLGGDMLKSNLISVNDLDLIEMWIYDLKFIGFEDVIVISNSEAAQAPCIGQDSLGGVYFHPSVRVQEYEHRSRQGKALAEENFENQLKESESFASRMLKRLCPSVDLKNVLSDNLESYDPHDNILVIVTFTKKDYENIPLLEIMYRHHFKNILYCGEPDAKVDEYMEHYNGQSGTYFSFLPVHHTQSAGYECLLGALEMGYIVDGFLIVNEDTLINSWNFGKDSLDPKTVWHGNEHAINVTTENLDNLETDSKEIMKSMLGILHAFQFLENVLLSDHPELVETELVPPPPPPLVSSETKHHHEKREASEDYSDEEMIMMHEEDVSEEDHEMSIVDDTENTTVSKEWHINLFGEIVHDEPEPENKNQAQQNITSHEVSELLYHPANFKSFETQEESNDQEVMKKEHFNDMMFNIKSIYKRMHDKLNLWIKFKQMRMQHNPNHEEMERMEKELEQLNCNKAANAEICHVVAGFFAVLDSNEGDSFQLVYDDLPIYYVPETLKDRLYLMANLFTKYYVNDRLAFPLLLRGLEQTDIWTKLTRADLSILKSADVSLSKPEDLLSEAFDDKIQSLEEIESADYLYPVEVKSVLTNEDLRTVVCRNF